MGEISTLIPEVYFDIITKIIPGSIFIWLFNLTTGSEIVNIQNLVLSYITGFCFHIIMTNCYKKFGRDDGSLWKWIRNDDTINKGLYSLYSKMMAEKALFRNLQPVMIATILSSVFINLFPNSTLHNLLSVQVYIINKIGLCWWLIMLLIAFTVFIWGEKTIYKSLENTKNRK